MGGRVNMQSVGKVVRYSAKVRNMDMSVKYRQRA